MSKTILITGASTGFGRITAEVLNNAGHTVFASMRSPAGKNIEHAGALRSQGIEVVELDVTDPESIKQALAKVQSKTKKLDVLVNNAGIASAGVSEAFTGKQVKALFDVNVIGLHNVTRAVLPIFRSQKEGLVINIGSILGRVTFPFFGIYGASKYAVEAITDSLRYEVSQLGVDVALIQPSAYPTSMYASIDLPQDQDRTDAYGDIGKIPNAMFEQFESMFEGEQAPNPTDVAEAINALVLTPNGERAARTVVGNSFGADTANEVLAPIQSAVISGLGLNILGS